MIFFFHIQGNDYFNNKVGYTFGHDNEEDGLNLSFSNFLRGFTYVSRTFMTINILQVVVELATLASSHSPTA